MKTSEHYRALVLPERWLETPPDMMGDPDCDQTFYFETVNQR